MKFMFSPPIVGCLLIKGFQKGGSQTPQEPPLFPNLATPLGHSHTRERLLSGGCWVERSIRGILPSWASAGAR